MLISYEISSGEFGGEAPQQRRGILAATFQQGERSSPFTRLPSHPSPDEGVFTCVHASDKNFNMKCTTQVRQESMFSAYKASARRANLGSPLICDGVWGAAHHNQQVCMTADERTTNHDHQSFAASCHRSCVLGIICQSVSWWDEFSCSANQPTSPNWFQQSSSVDIYIYIYV